MPKPYLNLYPTAAPRRPLSPLQLPKPPLYPPYRKMRTP
jgi:hypothetical protein